jgi:hypothetical protein
VPALLKRPVLLTAIPLRRHFHTENVVAGAGRLAAVWHGAIWIGVVSIPVALGIPAIEVLKPHVSANVFDAIFFPVATCGLLLPFAWVGQVSCATIAMRRTARVMREGTWDAQQEEPPAEPAGPPSAAAPPPDDTPQDPPDSPAEPSA